MRQSLTSLPLSILGAGRVATTMAVMLHRKGFRILSVVSRSEESARKLARRVHCRCLSTLPSDIDERTQILLFAVPEDVLPQLAEAVAESHVLPHYAFHVSGTETSDVLVALQRKGTQTFSLHPIQTFPSFLSLQQQIKRMKGVTYGFEGDIKALPFARRLVRFLNGKILLIPKEEKILYHTACVFASNYVVTLIDVVEKLLADVSNKASLAHIQPLIEASIANAIAEGPAKALTGPVVRGSITTLQKHITALAARDPAYAELYKALARRALEIVRQQNKLTEHQIHRMKEILEKGISL